MAVTASYLVQWVEYFKEKHDSDLMKKIGYFYGVSEGNTLEHFGRSLVPKLNELGYELVPINLTSKNLTQDLLTLIHQSPIFTFGYAGMGIDIKFIANNKEIDFCNYSGIPLISLYGDSPAYVEHLHLQNSHKQIGLYGFREHLALRKSFGRIVGGVGLSIPHIIENTKVDIRKKTNKDSPIVFLKNIHSHTKTLNYWNENYPTRIKDFLFETSLYLEESIETSTHTTIVDCVDKYIDQIGLDGEILHKLRLKLISELDKYIRGFKANFFANIFLDYPVEIHGSGWDQINLSNKIGKIISEVDYIRSESIILESMAQVSLSPNTEGGWHDRILRAAGAKRICISNYSQDEITENTFLSNLAFKLTEDSIRTRLDWLIDNREELIELGENFHKEISHRFSVEKFIANLEEHASIAKAI